jgi:hypothetical protein
MQVAGCLQSNEADLDIRITSKNGAAERQLSAVTLAEYTFPELQSQRQGKRAQRRHDPKALRTQARVQRAGDKGEHRGGCADTDRTVDRLRRTLEPLGHNAADQMHAGEMKQREGNAVQRLH